MHSIRTDFGFNLWRSASKLKRSVIENNWWVLLVFAYSWIFLFFRWVFFLPWIVMETLSVNHFQSNLFYILYGIRVSSTFLWTFLFNVIFCVCSQPDVNITWNTGHIHRSIVDKIEPTSEYVEMVNINTLSITLGYIFLWNVIRKMYFTVPSIDQ